MDSSQRLTVVYSWKSLFQSFQKPINFRNDWLQGVSKNKECHASFLNYMYETFFCDTKSWKCLKELLNLKDSGTTFFAAAVQITSKINSKTTWCVKPRFCWSVIVFVLLYIFKTHDIQCSRLVNLNVF